MPRWITQLRLILRSMFRKNQVDQELDEELQYHLDREIDEGLNRGLTPEAARYAALRAMGALAMSKEECRDMSYLTLFDDLSRDFQYATRSLRRNPGFATLAVLIMALGIGANTAVFSVVEAVLLKPLSYHDWHDQNTSFEAMAYFQAGDTAVIAGPTAEFAGDATVTNEFFNVFGV